MAITKYESYYNQIKENLITIKEEYGYNNLSQAFIFWYLKNYKNFTDQQIEESLIDGGNDNGIDAIILDEESQELTVMQFKFPDSINNINKEISQADILKTLNGFNVLISHNKSDIKCNDKFLEFEEQLQNVLIMKFNLYFIGFNNGVIDNKSYVETFAADFKQ